MLRVLLSGVSPVGSPPLVVALPGNYIPRSAPRIRDIPDAARTPERKLRAAGTAQAARSLVPASQNADLLAAVLTSDLVDTAHCSDVPVHWPSQLSKGMK